MPCDGCTSNLFQSLQHFSNLKSAYAYFKAHQVFPPTVNCSFCDKSATLLVPQNKWRCQRSRYNNGKKQRCTFTRALKTDTWLKGTHISMDTLGKLIVYYMLLPPPHQDFIQNELKISEKTVVNWSEVQWVFGGVPRGTRNVFLELVPNRKQATLMEVIHRRIHPGTTIMSDGWRAYNSISQEGVGSC